MMETKQIAPLFGCFLLLAFGGVESSAGAQGQSVGAAEHHEALTAEAARLQELVETPDVKARLGPVQSATVNRRLESVGVSLAGGSPQLGLRQLGLRQLAQVRIDLDRMSFQAEHAGLSDVATLERVCEETAGAVQRDREWSQDMPRPAALQALIDVSDGRARRYFASAPVHGAEAGVKAGLYYLSVAHSFARLTDFLVALPYASFAGGASSLPGLGDYLDRLEAEVAALYMPPFSIERHSEFVRISADLKFARQLEAEERSLGALELALDACTGLSQLVERESSAPADMEAALNSYHARISSSEVDHSIGLLLLARAEESLARGAVGDGRGTAVATSVLLGDVLPDYFACFEGESTEVESEDQVTVTLVRWPFT